MKTLDSFSLRTGAVLLAAIGVLAQSGVPQRKAAPQADTSYQQGMKDVQRGDLSGARTAFEQAVKLAPNSAEAHNSLGWVLLSQGHIEDAVAQLKTAVKLGPKLLQARINLANALVRQRDLSGAETEAREAVRLDPASAEAHRTLGRVLSFQKKLRTQLPNWGARSNSNLREPNCATNTARCWYRASRTRRQSSNSPKRFVCFQTSARPSCTWDCFAGSSNSWTKRRSCSRVQPRLLPESAQAHFYLARVLEDRGARDQAVRELQAAVKLQPDWPEAQTRLGAVAATSERYRSSSAGVAPGRRTSARQSRRAQ